MRVLVACEFSGIVRDAFRALGHDARSCDLLPTESEDKSYHWQCDVREIIELYPWDLIIASTLHASGRQWRTLVQG